ncbi:hypothetical protein BJY04DRAFT_219717 [Aspergillus karnatakaensis]|uniref:uncharacterized protein n=1 Tax=Aspergillus karnatakaensis TaxID=1810916 RepID=UPI003CCCFE62
MATPTEKQTAQMTPGNPSEVPYPIQLFESTRDSFIQDLGPDKFGQFLNAEALVRAIEQDVKSHPQNKSLVMLCARKINSLTEKLQPYFDIVNIFVQSNPSYAALVWDRSACYSRHLTNQYMTFLEKVCGMLNRLIATIPAYVEYLSIVKERAEKNGSSLSKRIPESLSRIYRDILEFCYYTCNLLSSGNKGIRARWRLFHRSAWRPFDSHFGAILESLKHHGEVFEREVNCFSTAETMAFITRYEDRVKEDEAQIATDARRHMDEQANEVLRWINAPDWMEIYERVQKRRLEGTCEWIQEDPVYQEWWSQRERSATSVERRILLIQGKPGYGKTTICAGLVQSLGAYVVTPAPPKSDKGNGFTTDVAGADHDQASSSTESFCVAFFFSTSRIVNAFRYNGKVLDLASLLMAKDQSGLPNATASQALALLYMLVQNIPGIVFVADGVDECPTHRQFVTDIIKVLKDSASCGLILLSRPTIEPHPRLGRDCYRITLEPAQNLADIELYVESNVEDLLDEGILDEVYSPKALVQRISSRADGMFIWVFLLLQYLSCPALTIKQRREAIEDLNRLEGLDNLYIAIFTGLGQEFPQTASFNVQRLFQWVTCCSRPLHIRELEVCISIPTHRPPEREDRNSDLRRNIAKLSGAMLEVTFDKHVRFIHLSTQEFFSGRGTSLSLDSPIRDLIDPTASNRYMAICCVAYLLYIVPAECFSSANQAMTWKQLNEAYPFLDYAVHSWPTHVLTTIYAKGPGAEKGNTQRSAEHEYLMDLISNLLSSESTLKMWIEASLIYSRFPSIQALYSHSDQAGGNETSYDQAENQRMKHIKSNISELAHDLRRLQASWSELLLREPHEIWEPSVSGFTTSRFWRGVNTSRVKFLNVRESSQFGYIVLTSRVATNGCEVGIVKLFPPKSSMIGAVDIADRPKLHEGEDWSGVYESWSLTTGNILYSIAVTISSPRWQLAPHVESELLDRYSGSSKLEQLRHLRAREFSETKWRNRMDDLFQEPVSRAYWLSRAAKNCTFKIPAAISADIRTVIIGNEIIRIADQNDEAEGARTHTPYRFDHQTLPCEPPDRILSQLRHDLEYSEKEYRRTPDIKLSPNAQYLVMVHYSRSEFIKDGECCPTRWLLQIFQHTAQPSVGLNFVLVASTEFFSDPDITLLGSLRGIEFHPRRLILFFPQVYEGSSRTYRWDFKFPLWPAGEVNVFSNPWPLCEPSLIDLQFSTDGQYLSGYIVEGEFDTVSADPSASSSKQSDSPARLPSDLDGTRPILAKTTATPRPAMDLASMIASDERPVVQGQNAVTVTRLSQDQLEISRLITSEADSSATLHTLNTTGQWKSQTLTRFPNEMRDRVSIDLIRQPPGEAEGNMRLVFNKQLRDSYSWKDVGDDTLPAVLDRAWSTVPVKTGKAAVDGANPFALLTSSSNSERRSLPIFGAGPAASGV